MSKSREFIFKRDPLQWGSWECNQIQPDGSLMPIGFYNSKRILEIEPGLRDIIKDRSIKQFWAMEGIKTNAN